MIQIDDKVISMDLIEKKFVCDLDACKGGCCVDGESGAPLEDDELKILEMDYESIRPYLRAKGNRAIEKQGTWIVDADREAVTPLIDGKECAYAIFQEGVAFCGIEKAFEAGATSFQKPISCHIYPIRLKNYKGFIAVNYDLWPICESARSCGENKGVPVYRFLREAIERKYGTGFYKKLEIISRSLVQMPDEQIKF